MPVQLKSYRLAFAICMIVFMLCVFSYIYLPLQPASAHVRKRKSLNDEIKDLFVDAVKLEIKLDKENEELKSANKAHDLLLDREHRRIIYGIPERR